MTVLSGNPLKELPHVRLFNRNMLVFNRIGLNAIKLSQLYDIGYTWSKDCRIWQAFYSMTKRKSPQ
jgi:hypothetical protein